MGSSLSSKLIFSHLIHASACAPMHYPGKSHTPAMRPTLQPTMHPLPCAPPCTPCTSCHGPPCALMHIPPCASMQDIFSLNQNQLVDGELDLKDLRHIMSCCRGGEGGGGKVWGSVG